MLLRADEGHIVNTWSASGLWTALMPGISHKAYSAVKIAVKRFPEALVTDCATMRNSSLHTSGEQRTLMGDSLDSLVTTN